MCDRLTTQTGRTIDVGQTKVPGTTANAKDELVLRPVVDEQTLDLDGGCAATPVVGGRGRSSRSCSHSCLPGTRDVAGPMTVHGGNAGVACDHGAKAVHASAD